MAKMTSALVRERAETRKREEAVIGLSSIPGGVKFQCGTCEYFKDDTCRNINPRLYGRTVKAEWCCNLFDSPGMKVIVS